MVFERELPLRAIRKSRYISGPSWMEQDKDCPSRSDRERLFLIGPYSSSVPLLRQNTSERRRPHTAVLRQPGRSLRTGGSRLLCRWQISSNRAVLTAVVICLCGLLLTGCGAHRQRTQKHTDDALALAEQARRANERGEADAAAVLMSAAVRSNPKDCEARLELSDLLVDDGSLESALDHLQRVVQQNPDDPRGYIKLAEVLVLTGELETADRWLAVGLELDPGNIDGLLLQARMCQRRGQSTEATVLYQRILGLDPDDIDASLGLAQVYLKGSEPTRAVPLLRNVVRQEKATSRQTSAAHWMLGNAYFRTRRWPEAATHLAAASEHRKMTGDDWYRLAMAEARAGNQPAARIATGKALQQSPQLTAALELQTLLNLQQRNTRTVSREPVLRTATAETANSERTSSETTVPELPRILPAGSSRAE